MTFHYTVETSKSVEETVQALETALKEEQFGILWDFNMQGKLLEKGFDFQTQYRILEVCNPGEANKVLSEDLNVGYFLPCKIAVYEDAGKTKIGMPKPSMMIELVNNPKLNEIANEVETKLIRSINNAK